MTDDIVTDVPVQRTRPRRTPHPQKWPVQPNVPAGNRTLVFLAFIASLAFLTAALAVVWLPESVEPRHVVVAIMFGAKAVATMIGARRLYTVLVLGRGRRRA